MDGQASHYSSMTIPTALVCPLFLSLAIIYILHGH
jgi:hypothetical protein